MTRTNLYVHVNTVDKKVFSHPTEVPENWSNIHGFSNLTDTEISDLTPYNRPNEAWLKFDSSFPVDDYTYDDDWLDGAKGTIKLAYKKQRQEAIKKGVSYNSIIFDADAETQTKMNIKKDSSATSFNWKYNNTFHTLSKSDITAVHKDLDDYIQKCYDKEATYVSQIEAATTKAGLNSFTLDGTWPTNAY